MTTRMEVGDLPGPRKVVVHGASHGVDGEEAARTRRGGDHQGFSTSINPCPIRDVTRPGADPTLECHGEHSTAGARRSGLVGGHDVYHPATECVRRDAVDREAAQVEQTRGVRYQILLNMGNSRTLRQARGLTLIMNTVLTTAMITRSGASYVSALDPSCPVKSEEPSNRLSAAVREEYAGKLRRRPALRQPRSVPMQPRCVSARPRLGHRRTWRRP